MLFKLPVGFSFIVLELFSPFIGMSIFYAHIRFFSSEIAILDCSSKYYFPGRVVQLQRPLEME